MTNDIGHPIMGAVYSHIYTNHDRACARIAYGDAGYWSCMRRATIYAAIASVKSDSPKFVAGSISTLEDCYRPDLVPSDEELLEILAQTKDP